MKQELTEILCKKSFKYSEEPVFKLVSGEMSRFYINCKPTVLSPRGMYLAGHLVFEAIGDLAADAIEKQMSGHPGLPLGAADIGTFLFTHVLHHNPKNPAWMGRDRFVLSAGHGSMLLYSLLHLCGYDLSIEDIKNFIASWPIDLTCGFISQ